MNLLRNSDGCMDLRKCLLTILLAGPALFAGPDAGGANEVDLGRDGPFAHVRAFQAIATENGGNRASGTPGFDRSADYVAERLNAAGYKVRLESFEFPYFEERSPPILLHDSGGASTAVSSEALRTLANSGAGAVTAGLRSIDFDVPAGPGASTSGCEPSDFEGFEPGAIALVRRGTCPFQTKVENAEAAGAVGVILVNVGAPTEVFAGRLARPVRVPVVGVSSEAGDLLANRARAAPGLTVHLAVNAETGTRSTRNVLAETFAGDATETLVVGAHLDSVAEGPGINDNGSGSAAVLEAALRLAAIPVRSGKRVRFAFWGAEERGLLGSRHHLQAVPEDERRRIVLYINLDMVGSPNFGRFVQGSASSADGPAGIARNALLDHFRAKGLAVEERWASDRPRSFGSDDASFARIGVPTLGLYTGAGETRTEADAVRFGGQANQPYDSCYHRACDDIENIDRGILEVMTEAVVSTLRSVAYGEGQLAPAALVPQ
jgi:Zn-dependent M28 family amino/carboxypeptidase